MKVPESFVLKFHVVRELLDGRLLLSCQVLDARSADLLNVGAFPGACQLCLINSDLLHDHAVYNLFFPIVRSTTKKSLRWASSYETEDLLRCLLRFFRRVGRSDILGALLALLARCWLQR
jgi:hypothetical protein